MTSACRASNLTAVYTKFGTPSSNGAIDERFERATSSAGQPYFNLNAGNGQVIGRSEMYSSASAMENGIASVKSNAPDAPVKDLTES
ncbi:YegP family protein [Rhodoferax sp. PAMC 29310]|uniref:YegP family protein n=1 Tax=Rhodoferax sp. PAMC 29310 TaxID=2822760 RepID=UPI001B34533E|nr:YegP family protein [Rhodoferax sp. PAMC 29310]